MQLHCLKCFFKSFGIRFHRLHTAFNICCFTLLGGGMSALAAGVSHRPRAVGLARHSPIPVPPSGRWRLPDAPAWRAAAPSTVQTLSHNAGQQPQRGFVLPDLRADQQPRPAPDDDVSRGLPGRTQRIVSLLSAVPTPPYSGQHRHGRHQGTSTAL